MEYNLMRTLGMSYSEVEECPFDEIQAFLNLYRKEMESRKQAREEAKTGRKMVDLRTMMGI